MARAATRVAAARRNVAVLVGLGIIPGPGGGGPVLPTRRLVVGGSRIQLASNTIASGASNVAHQYAQFVGLHPGDGPQNLTGGWLNGYSAAGVITATGNALTVERVGYYCNGTYYPAKIGGADGRTLASGETVRHDAVTIPNAPAGTPIYAETVALVAQGDKYPYVGIPYGVNAALGEGYASGSASRAANAGTKPAAALPTGGPFGLCFFFMERPASEWRSAVLKDNDSIGQGASVGPMHYDARGCVGFFAQALDRATAGSRRVWDVGMFGESMLATQPKNGSKSVLEWVKEVCDLVGSVPFAEVWDQLGHNDMSQGTLAAVQASYTDRRDYIRTNFGNPRYCHLGITGRTTSTDFFTTEAGQSPYTTGGATQWSANGLMEQTRAWLAAGGGGTIDIYLAHHEAVHNGLIFKEPAFKGTLKTELVANTSSTVVAIPDSGSAIPTKGMRLVLNPTGANGAAGDAGAYIVDTVTADGAGGYACTIKDGSGFAKKILLAHPVGEIVRSSCSPDGEHFNAPQHDAMRDWLISRIPAPLAA